VLRIVGAMCLTGCFSESAHDKVSSEEHDLSLLKTEVQRLNREMEWLHQQVTAQQNRMDVGQAMASTSAPSSSPMRQQSVERKICGLEQIVENLARDLKDTQAAHSETAHLVRKLQQENFGALEKKVTELMKVRQDVQQLVKALDGEASSSDSHAGGRGSTTVRVKPGDTLEKIARQHSCSVDTIRRLNRLKSDRITVGQHLNLP
jgi:outer membrane murein-binding lipoprotein Lpp